MADMSADVLKNNLTNPAKAFLWSVVFPGLVGGGDAEALETRCQSTGIPGRSVGAIVIPYKGTPGIVFPGKLNLDHTWSTTFVESAADRKTFDALYAWHQSIQNVQTGLGGPDNTLKRNLYLKCEDQEGNVWLTIKLTGCYPQDVGAVALSYASQEQITFPVRWAYDRWEKVD
jgi:hypothetical protein